MAGRPLRPATRRRLGRPSPHQQADRPRAHPEPKNLSNHHHAAAIQYPVLATLSSRYPKVRGRLLTCYSPVRHSPPKPKSRRSVRLACVKHAASVRPEPGSNSPTKNLRPRNSNQTHQKTNWHQKYNSKKPPQPQKESEQTRTHKQTTKNLTVSKCIPNKKWH